jgi:molybdopterin/thiamine biosynthesis adenylyltransferase
MTIFHTDVRRLARKSPGAGRMKYPVHLLGVGGVGSNIIWQSCRAPFPERLFFKIHDPDTIETHNLNRTLLFRLDQVGTPGTRWTST